MFRFVPRRSLASGGISEAARGAARGARARRRARRAILPHLRGVGRVDAPESDMRPVLPGRASLMAAVAPRGAAAGGGGGDAARRPRDAYLAGLRRAATAAAAAGDDAAVAALAAGAAAAPYPVERDVALRVVTLTALQHARAADGGRGGFAEAVLARLAGNGCLESMRRVDMGSVLDIMARGMALRGDAAGAFRVERLSRVLEVGLRRGTYTHLIRLAGQGADRGGLALSLGVFHRALVVGKAPNAAMFNTILEVCFRARDGARASAVLVEMARENVAANGKTLSILLENTRDASNVDAVFRLLKGQVSRAGLKLTPGMAVPFVKAYIATAAAGGGGGGGGDPAYIEKCFTLVDWFHARGAGVTANALDLLVAHLGAANNAEGALHAYREMRRGWLGPPTRRGRRALLTAVAASDAPGRAAAVLWPRLAPAMSAREVRRRRRLHLGAGDAASDAAALAAVATAGDDADAARDAAAVLHGWCGSGRTQEAVAWVDGALRAGVRVDARVILALLSARTPGGGGDALYPLGFVLERLGRAAGARADVLDRAEAAIWGWVARGGGGAPFAAERGACRRYLEALVPAEL